MALKQQQIRKMITLAQLAKKGGTTTDLLLAQLLGVLNERTVFTKGDPGDDGKVPQKGTDYFTKEEIQQLSDQILQRVEYRMRQPKDGKTPVAGSDYPTRPQMEEMLRTLVKDIKIPVPANGKTPTKGVDYLTEIEIDVFISRVIRELGAKFPKSDTPEQVRDKLSSLTGEARLDAAAIKNLPEKIQQAMPQISLPGGSRTIEILDEGISLGQDIRKIIFIGSGVTASRVGDGVVAVTVSGGGGSSLSASFNEIPGGAQDGSNTSFTLAHTPDETSYPFSLYNNGQLLTGGGVDYTRSGMSLTLINAPFASDVLRAYYQY